jgi:hypothetical protein
MLCPTCGKKPLAFSKFVMTLNPFAIQCGHCATRLRAGPWAHVWTLFHAPIGVGIWIIGRRLAAAGLFDSLWGPVAYWACAAALLFFTAYVVPWLAFKNLYRVA